MKRAVLFSAFCLVVLSYCTAKEEKSVSVELSNPDSIVKDFLYDQHTLADSYPYKDTTREFQWDKIREQLSWLESAQQESATWLILQNYKNEKGEAPLVGNYHPDSYNTMADSLGVERFQGIPLYLPTDTTVPELYGRDGSLVKCLEEYTNFIKVAFIHTGKEWMIPTQYIKVIADTVVFRKTIFVDTKNQNIATLEHEGDKWLVRSMNPATTGLHKPPYEQETPSGIFVIQEKKLKMIYLADGTKETGGFAPYASRFTDGGYIHGVPVNAPRTTVIEFSPTLGTTPRSHMCVRNATSHAQFIYDWAPVEEALVFVFD